MQIWKIKELREQLKKTLTSDRYKDACKLLTSLDWKIRAEQYHAHTAQEAFHEHFGCSELTPIEVLNSAFNDLDVAAKFSYSKSVREFNLVAAISTSHTTPEIFCQLIALLFIPNKIEVNDITPNKVISHLSNIELENALRDITDSAEYKYFQAFTNMSKHRSLVIPDYHLVLDDNESHGVRFKEFKYRRNIFKPKRDVDLIEELSIMRTKFIKLGIIISKLSA